MYFANGWPKLFTFENQTPEDLITDISHLFFESPLGNVVAVVTGSSVLVWSADQQRILLGSLHRHSLSVSKEGDNRQVLWGPAGTRVHVLVVRTSLGNLHFYGVSGSGGDLTEFSFAKEHHYIRLGPKQAVKIEFKHAVQLDGGAVCMASSGDFLFVCTKDGYLVKVTWTGEISEKILLGSIGFSYQAQVPSPSEVPASPRRLKIEPKVYGKHLTFNATLSLLGIVFSNGAAASLQVVAQSVRNGVGVYFGASTAVIMAFNPKHQIVAIGTSLGEVHIYHLVEAKHGRTFTLAPWGITPEAVGKVSCMSWTADWCCLAVGWKNRGLALWSIYGCRLMSTIPQLEPTSSMKSGHFQEPLAKGTSALSWGCEGYQLLVGCKGDAIGKLMQFDLVKSSLAQNPNLNWSERILLQGDDRLLLLSYRGSQLEDITWEHLQVPHTYLNDNWPVRSIAVSRDGTQVAVAGTRGLTLYNSTTRRWKLFGDRNQEQQIQCYALTWYKHTVAVANYNSSSREFEILFYPKTHLDQSSMLHRSNLPSKRKPYFLDCNDNHLILFTTDSFFYQYLIVPVFKSAQSGEANQRSEISAIKLRLVHQVSMAKFTLSPLSLTLLPNAAKSPTAKLGSSADSAKCLILNPSGLLALSNAEENLQIPLASFVEQFWVANYSDANYEEVYDAEKDLGNTLWAYGEAGLQVWFPFFSGSELHATKLMSRDNSLEFDLEVYPIGFVAELGVIVGISQELMYSQCSKFPSFELKVKMHPFLHSILRHLVENGDQAKAMSIAKKFSFIPHFSHSLELLLHETLEEDKNAGESLRRVIEFLRQFSQFPDIVMRCARKRDPAVWRKLFSLVGSPKELFEQCLSSKRVQTAASYLRILQFLEGTRESRSSALKLLDETLNTDDLELAGDLMRFLQPSEEVADLSQSQVDGQEGTNGTELDLDDQEYYLQELLLARYARKLLAQQQLRKLIRFSRGVAHELKPWLIRERRRAALIEDFDTALAMLHLQFNLPFPNVLQERSEVLSKERVEELKLRRKLSSDLSEDSLAASRWELSELLDEMLSAECVEWSLLIATVLLDVRTILSILKQHGSLWKSYQHALSGQESVGYQELLARLELEAKDLTQTPRETTQNLPEHFANSNVFT